MKGIATKSPLDSFQLRGSPSLVRCDRCGAENPANLIFCRDCGNRLPGAEMTVPAVEARAVAARPAAPSFEFAPRGGPAPSMSACARCGVANPPANRFCSGCGSPMAGSSATPPVVAAPHSPGVLPSPPQAGYRAPLPPLPAQPSLSPSNLRAAAPVGGAQKATAICGRCRGVNPGDMRFCQFCGAPLTGSSAEIPAHAHVMRPPAGVRPSEHPPAKLPQEAPFHQQPVPARATGEGWAGATSIARGAARLVVITQDGTPGRTYEIAEAQVDVGREEGGILLPNDPYVSPRHARLRRQTGHFTVRDLGSVNGVYARLRRAERLEHGDLVLVGLEVLRFELVSDAEKALGPALERGTQVFGSPASTRYARLCQRTIEGVTRDIYSLYRDETIIGRESGDIVFTNDPFMSRQHAAIARDPYEGSFTVRDLGSSNGTYLAIRGEVALQSGDHLRIGQHLFRLEVDPE